MDETPPHSPHRLPAPAETPAVPDEQQPRAADDEARDPDEVLSPPPYRDPADFAPIPPPQASFADFVELAGHIAFVILVAVVLPLMAIWAVYRLYRWLPFETMALVVVGLASLWAYRDRLAPLLRRVVFGRERAGR